jgi:hypothetical protein
MTQTLTDVIKELKQVQRDLAKMSKQINEMKGINFDERKGNDRAGKVAGNVNDFGKSGEEPGVYYGEYVDYNSGDQQRQMRVTEAAPLCKVGPYSTHKRVVDDGVTNRFDDAGVSGKIAERLNKVAKVSSHGYHVLHKGPGNRQVTAKFDDIINNLEKDLPDGKYFSVGLMRKGDLFVKRKKNMTKPETIAFISNELKNGNGVENSLSVTETIPSPIKRVATLLKKALFPLENKVENAMGRMAFRSWVVESVPQPDARHILQAFKELGKSEFKSDRNVRSWMGRNMHRDPRGTACALKALAACEGVSKPWEFLNQIKKTVDKHSERGR